jgi:hypothetical protein
MRTKIDRHVTGGDRRLNWTVLVNLPGHRHFRQPFGAPDQGLPHAALGTNDNNFCRHNALRLQKQWW